MSHHLKDRRYWFWTICSNQDGCHKTLEIYVLSKVIYACECDISKAVSPISFKLEICFSYYLENRRFDFGPSVKNKIAAIELLKMFAMDNPCESGILRTISPIHFKLEICFDIIYRTDAIDIRPSAKNKMAAIKNVCYGQPVWTRFL